MTNVANRNPGILAKSILTVDQVQRRSVFHVNDLEPAHPRKVAVQGPVDIRRDVPDQLHAADAGGPDGVELQVGLGGAGLAGGEFVVMLNNDTQVLDGWLDALLETFEEFPDTGLAGARLVYPDGRLQEAGGIVFNDGSGWNYGRLDDPSRPEYLYTREVDYVSGACIALRRELFEELGGFDAQYAPAYYEDTDLAFRIRAHGLKGAVLPHARQQERAFHLEEQIALDSAVDASADLAGLVLQLLELPEHLAEVGLDLALLGPELCCGMADERGRARTARDAHGAGRHPARHRERGRSLR